MISSSEVRQTSEEELIRQLRLHLDRPVPGSGMSRLIGSLLPESLRPQVRVWATHMMEPAQRSVARRLSKNAPVKLNIGCGTLRMDGWVNIDLVGLPVDLAWDIRRTLPFVDDSVDVIFHEHVMEHVCAYDGFMMAKDSYRMLKPGGVLRIVMPDANRYIRSYVNPTSSDSILREGRLTPMIALTEEFYGFNHRAMYDYETVELFLRTAGFTKVESTSFGKSRIDPCPDCEERICDSFYTEAVK